ncbi:hypothetical protein EV379_2339 [Microterricola gilva]|uniref:Uncharacterized protein n=1 Tax=Microterricola gilva TaxID=393267 RepID=A0A4Q8AN29_9MICO|nr:hypothetical protein [Microterricola gilva]RZU65994.1 hypothetical protein EV379_2339 [Microterricola gilva]
MSEMWIGLLVVGGTVVVLLGLALLAQRIRRRGTAGPAIGAAMAAYDQAMHVTAYETFLEMQAQDERVTPTPSPDTH